MESELELLSAQLWQHKNYTILDNCDDIAISDFNATIWHHIHVTHKNDLKKLQKNSVLL